MKKQSYFLLTVFGFLTLGMVIAEIDYLINDRPIALVRRYIPSVTIQNIESDSADVGTDLFSGDTLTTDENGFALVLFIDQSTARVRPGSQLIVRGNIDRRQNSNTRIDIERGELFMEVTRRGNNDFEVATSSTVASVKGTKFGARENGYFWVDEGEVEVLALLTGEIASITDGMFAQVSEDGSDITTGQLTEEEMDNLNSEYGILDQDLNEKRMILRFRDANGQIREIEIDYYEQNQQ
jgi:hypothetical protein